MNPLREVIAKFSVVVDDVGIDSLAKKIDRLKGSYAAVALGATAALGMAAAASYKFIQAASGVTEQQNKISALFGVQRQREIIEWSKTVETEMGRSEYAFQSSFSDFAAFLDPLKLGEERVIKMSKGLARLKVDLASFYNTSEEDAQMRLFSGMAGETEAVRRLGIDISDTALSALYQSKDNPLDPQGRAGQGAHGLNRGKGIASMTLQDKALLRYKKIVMDTQKAQGDAARTATGWANTLKRLQDRFFRLEVALGKLAEGPGTKFLNLLEVLVTTSEKVATKTKTVQLALQTLGGVAVMWTTRWALANKALLVSLSELAIPLAGLVAAFLVVEDLWTFFSDDDAETGFGKLVKMITGVERPLHRVAEIFATIQDRMAKLYNEWIRISGVDWEKANDRNRDQMDDEEARARNKALEEGDIDSFVAHRKTNETQEEAEQRFLKQRPWFVRNGISKPMEEDYNNPYMTGLTAPTNAGGGSMSMGDIVISPQITNLFQGATMSVGEVKQVVKEAVNESVQQGAAALGRRGVGVGRTGAGGFVR